MNYTAWCRWLVVIAVGLATAGLPARAQSPYVAATSLALPEASPSTGTGSSDPLLTIKARGNEAHVLCMATDRRGKFVRTLNQGDFSILDDHKPPTAIINFRRETDLPLE